MVDIQETYTFDIWLGIEWKYTLSLYTQQCRPFQLFPVSKKDILRGIDGETDLPEHSRHLLPDMCGQLDSKTELLD